MKILVTGGAGFIGSNFLHYILNKYPDDKVTNLDKLTYAGNLENLKDLENTPEYEFILGDITDRELVSSVLSRGYDAVVNFAAESHVDRSIMDSAAFIETNVRGTQVLLEGARQCGVSRYLQVSTDEVYGSLENGYAVEDSKLLPNSPYAASKTAADLICRSYIKTYNMPVMITRCSNNYGPFQFPEKFLPVIITNALEEKEIPVYGDGLNIREWINVYDHCRALDVVLRNGKPGELYNVGTNEERTNLEMVYLILDIMGKSRDLVKFVSDRPGHDRRYALDAGKIKRCLGWEPEISFEDGIASTVKWYMDNQQWWQRIKSGEYTEYSQKVSSR